MKTLFDLLNVVLTPDEAIELRRVKAHFEVIDPLAGLNSRLDWIIGQSDPSVLRQNMHDPALIAGVLKLVFTWKDTPQGEDYWTRVYVRYAHRGNSLIPPTKAIN